MKKIIPTVLSVCLCLCVTLPAGVRAGWQWTAPAAHHRAAVKIRSPANGNSASVTTGTLVTWGSLRGIITCAHGLESQTVKITFADGQSVVAPCTKSQDGADVGWIYADHPSLPHVPVSTTPPRQGAVAEFVTLGGPDGRLRHFTAQTGKTTPRMQYWSTEVVSGDSGGGILQGGKLVGVQSVGMGNPIRSDWPTYRGAGSATHSATCGFLNRVILARRARALRSSGGPGSGFYPPQPFEKRAIINIASPQRVPGLINIFSPQHRAGYPADAVAFAGNGVPRTQQQCQPIQCPPQQCPVCPVEPPPAPAPDPIEPVPDPEATSPAQAAAAVGIYAHVPVTIDGAVNIRSGGQIIRSYILTPK